MSIGMGLAAFLAAALVLVPLPGHWRARNVPMLSMIIWLCVINITYGVNAIAWYNNVERKLLTWCDITIRLDIGANVSLPAACFCLAMHLESVASIRQVRITRSDKQRRMLIDLAICLGVPLMEMALFYIVQGHRFDIVEDFGCRPETYVSIPEFFTIWLLPILFCLGTFALSGLSFLHFYRRRASFAKHLANSNSALTPSRYFRLMSLSLVEMIWALLVISLTLSFNYRSGLRPWTNWADVHSNFGNINRFPLLLISPSELQWTYLLWWSLPVSAYILFAFFGFSQDALREYGSYVKWFRRSVLRQKLQSKPAQSFGSFGPASPSGVSSWPRVPAPRSVVSSFADDKLEEGPPTPGDVDGGLAPSGGKPTVASISAPDNFGTERLSTDGGHPHEDSPPSYPGLLSVPSPAMIPKPSSVVLTSEGQQFLLSRYSQDDHRRVV